MSDISSEEIEQMKEEVFALIGAWMDRGVSPTFSAMVLASQAHSVLVEMGVPLSKFLETVTDAWKRSNGKL